MKEIIKYHEDKYKYYLERIKSFRNQRTVAKISNMDYYYTEIVKSLEKAKKHRKWINILKELSK